MNRKVISDPDEFQSSAEAVKEFVWACIKAGASPEDLLGFAIEHGRGLPKPLNISQIESIIHDLSDLHQGPVNTGYDLFKLPKTEWVWPNYIAKGHLNFLIGEQGVAKSGFAQDLARRKSKGGTWPDKSIIRERSKTLWIDAEGAKTLIRDRMVKWNMNYWDLILPMQKDLFADFVITDENDRLVQDILGKYKPSLVVVDSLSGTHGYDENKANIIKPTILKLRYWASKYNCGVLVIHHVNKKHPLETSRRLDLNRIRGSSLIAAQARSVLALDVVQTTGEGLVHRLYQIKNNLGPISRGDLFFKVHDDGLQFLNTSGVSLKMNTSGLSKSEKAQKLLLDLLKDGPKPVKEIKNRMKQERISDSTMNRAKAHLKVKSVTEGVGSGWYWELP